MQTFRTFNDKVFVYLGQSSDGGGGGALEHIDG
jgi:hypothetical protein